MVIFCMQSTVGKTYLTTRAERIKIVAYVCDVT